MAKLLQLLVRDAPISSVIPFNYHKHLTKICMSVNSYLHCIKYTATHLTQSHFMLFTQFFIYLWNTEKTDRFIKIVETAIAGAQ